MTVGLAACVLTAGCSASGGSGGPAPSASTASVTPPAGTSASSTSSSAPAVTVTVTSPPASSSSSAHTVVPTCTSDIRVIPGTPHIGAGHRAELVLVFNNVSRTRTCQMRGYPGVDLVTVGGALVAHVPRALRGPAGGEPAGVKAPQSVVLAPGHSASALAEGSAVVNPGAPDLVDCTFYPLVVTPPDQFVSVPAGTASLPKCGVQVHPVVAGLTGGLR